MKQITITLFKSEIIYDVQNKAHLTARSNSASDGVEAAANMQPSDAEPDSNQIMRSITTAFALLKPKLSPYITEIVTQLPPEELPEVTSLESNNLLFDSQSNNMLLNLTMPDNFNHAFMDAVTTSLHGYMVDNILAEWFTLTTPAAAAMYYQKAESELELAKGYLSARIERVHRPVSVF